MGAADDDDEEDSRSQSEPGKGKKKNKSKKSKEDKRKNGEGKASKKAGSKDKKDKKKKDKSKKDSRKASKDRGSLTSKASAAVGDKQSGTHEHLPKVPAAYEPQSSARFGAVKGLQFSSPDWDAFEKHAKRVRQGLGGAAGETMGHEQCLAGLWCVKPLFPLR